MDFDVLIDKSFVRNRVKKVREWGRATPWAKRIQKVHKPLSETFDVSEPFRRNWPSVYHKKGHIPAAMWRRFIGTCWAQGGFSEACYFACVQVF